MRQEAEPTPEGLKRFDKHEEALEEFGEDLKRGLSDSDEKFEEQRERTIKELGGKIIKENKDKRSVEEAEEEEKETIH